MKRELILLTMIIICILPSFTSAQAHQPKILIIYGSEIDRTAISNMTSNLNQSQFQVTEVSSNVVQSGDISNQDLIIIASSGDFSLEDTVEQALQNYLLDTSHHLIMITPHLDELSDNFRQVLGISKINEIIGGDVPFQWTINPTTNFLGYNITDSFQYAGAAAIVTLQSSINVLANFTAVTGSNDTSEVSLPSPAIWNSTQNANIQVIATSLNDTSNQNDSNLGLRLSQVTDFINSIIKDIVVNVYQKVLVISEKPNNTTDTIGKNTGGNDTVTTGNSNTGGSIPGLPVNLGVGSPTFQLSLIALLFGLVILLFSRIMGFVNWLTRKFYGIAIFVVGAFYNVQDRTLSHNDVTMNNSRADILAYLNYVGSFGAHLREIKSVTKLGSGSLLWHLQVLEDYGYIDKFGIDSYTIFVAEGFTLDVELKEIELKLQSKYTFDILDYLAHLDIQIVSLAEIEEETEINRRSLRRLINKLADKHLVTIDKYPQMTITIVEMDMIKELFHSLNLRETFSFERVSDY